MQPVVKILIASGPGTLPVTLVLVAHVHNLINSDFKNKMISIDSIQHVSAVVTKRSHYDQTSNIM
jgi:hypothetical protein